MLVSSIARFDAIRTMNDAAFQSIQISNAMTNSRTFGGEHDLNMLHKLDNKLSLDLATNSLLYKIAYLQEKFFAKMQAKEISQKTIDYKA